MRLCRSTRLGVLATGVAAMVLASQVGATAGTTLSLGTLSDQSCPAKLAQSNRTPPPYSWSAAFRCRISARASINGVSTVMTGRVTASYATWTTSTAQACASNASFTTTITFSYADKAGTVRFSAPMEVLGSTISGGSPQQQQWCFTQYSRSYQKPNNVRITGTGAYLPLNELCGFGLGVRTDARGGDVYFNVDDQFGTANQCFTYSA